MVDSMRPQGWSRRRFVAASLAMAGAVPFSRAADRQAVLHSQGDEPPALAAPEGACDCHMHIYDPRFAPSPHWKNPPPVAPVSAYRQFQKRIGTSRTVVVTPSTYGVDNRCTLDALRQLGDGARGIAVVDADVADAELYRLRDGGVTGLRVNFVSAQSWGMTTPEMLEALARRVSPLGWHIQILMSAEQIATHSAMLQRLPTPIVFDHLARIPQPAGISHPAFGVVAGLMRTGKAYVKLSGAYMDTATGAPAYADVSTVARAFVETAPSQVIWGSDWPHPTEKHKPDDAVLFDLLKQWAPDDGVRRQILVDTPARLYQFA
ncbi:amidohydrolase family protein [Cupriavidus sp. H18C2]|uniref:amidohydrolase family protein n=1 Tax=Cupriavidus sp. H18C2 TaxID=3241602 RepID=UPI003BF7C6D6